MSTGDAGARPTTAQRRAASSRDDNLLDITALRDEDAPLADTINRELLKRENQKRAVRLFVHGYVCHNPLISRRYRSTMSVSTRRRSMPLRPPLQHSGTLGTTATRHGVPSAVHLTWYVREQMVLYNILKSCFLQNEHARQLRELRERQQGSKAHQQNTFGEYTRE